MEVEIERGLERVIALNSHATLCASLYSIAGGIGGDGRDDCEF